MAATLPSKTCLSASILAFASLVNAVPYALSESYSGANFFDNFNFITSDPSGGWVTYLDQAAAQSGGYIGATSSGAWMGVDDQDVISPDGPGRNSVRIESINSFQEGLFIGDFSHMPTGCGTWPAFWMYGPDWPTNGEIDIIEGVNNQATNQVSAHTSEGCVISATNGLATMINNQCYQPVTNSGCSFRANGIYSYGDLFNSIGGGVYAVQWTADWISVWFFKRGSVPADITSETPSPNTWGRPMAMFGGENANINQRFNSMKIVLNTDFCGAWAQGVWGSCPGTSCVDYVASTPSAFSEAYWGINSINIYYPTQPIPYPAQGWADFKEPDELVNVTSSENGTYVAPTATGGFSPSSVLSFSSATPLNSLTSVSLVPDAMGATIAPAIGPLPSNATTTLVPKTLTASLVTVTTGVPPSSTITSAASPGVSSTPVTSFLASSTASA